MMLIFAVLIGLVLGGEWALRGYVARGLEKTRVSSLPETDYVSPRLATWLAIGGAGLVVLALLACALWSAPVLLGIALAGLFGVFRWTLANLVLTGARVSVTARMFEAMAHPQIKAAKFAFHFSAPDLAQPEHVNIWGGEINEIGVPWCVILREVHHLKTYDVARLPPALFVPNEAALAGCLPSGARAVFYANNGQKNRKMIAAHPSLTHIQLLHGDSDKPPSYSPLAQNYDLVFVAGQMGIDRYALNGVHIPAEKFRIVGRPQVRAIESGAATAAEGPRKIVYMPTWRGFYEDTQFSSLDRAPKIIETLLAAEAGLEVHFKPHPLSYKDPLWPKFEREIRTALGRKRANGNTGVFREDGTSPFALYNEADLLITDISSVMIDYLYSGKPFLVVQPPGFDAADRVRFPSLAASYEVDAGLDNLAAQLGAALGEDPLRVAREEVRLSAFGDYGRPVGEAFRAACLALLEEHSDG
jgi:hypothetical protein